ncbi:hypothetical protein SPSIL_056630 [Sporomusa silvacetica DSM 10669]|uniref:Uncharacterized protein n=1 Tax=Sporomusa silvacetica DSM 10669 TaxID=1123289 RepID=A0ABZ3IUM8_9FIRM|nr:hypothetical protein [Sporomusa silvacetica]OZC12953.1 hypothetical protein SPSIL_56720 [Sporomusa silvacetica DSM 10669]
MVQAEVYERINIIYRTLQDDKDTLGQYLVDSLYDELENLCKIILKERLRQLQ